MDLSDRYSSLDRLLHRIAFATAPLQIEMADLEDRLCRAELAGIDVRQPVFITALPRAGTTLLLDLCVALDEFASHCYRDMPFVLLPMMWDRLSRHFRRNDVPTERAHGDGMLVSLDSAEAFEEMLWRAMWPDHYLPDRILTWDRCDNAEFRGVFVNHMRKVIRLRQAPGAVAPRYVSKNNGNISRTRALADCCPDATIVVILREPVQHAASLLRQHKQFLAIHARDAFAREYMEGIGHLEFGANLRPIDFDGWLATAVHPDPSSLGFWMEYWCAAYTHLLEQRGPLHFLPFDWLCSCPADGLAVLGDLLSIQDRDAWMAHRPRITPPKPHEADVRGVDRGVLSRAADVYARVLDRSLASRAYVAR